jgi:N,N'-diacetylbacillosaminyl-diphospho-undecaprenol alpha-1,3-N-acetylgalactosaminyltransferase
MLFSGALHFLDVIFYSKLSLVSVSGILYMVQIVHSIHFPVSAKSFVAPIVEYLNHIGISTELWLENNPKHYSIIQCLNIPKSFVKSDLTFNPIFLLARVITYSKKLNLHKPIVLHTHQSRASLIPLISSFFCQVPNRIYHNHGLPYLGYSGPMRMFLWCLEYLNMRLATHVLFVSQSNLDAAVSDRLLSPCKAHILGYGTAIGIDLNHYELTNFDGSARAIARHDLGIPERAFVLAYIGRPVKRKGLHFLLESWQLTGLAQQGHILMIAGCTVDECVQALGHPTAGVKALGYLNDLKSFYAASDALTLPSRHEGFPYSLLEAAAAGLPLIGTDIPGVRCAIQPNKTGLLVPFNDKDALSNAIQQIANDVNFRQYLGKNARVRVEQEFDRPIVLSALLEFYHQECPSIFDDAISPSRTYDRPSINDDC